MQEKIEIYPKFERKPPNTLESYLKLEGDSLSVRIT